MSKVTWKHPDPAPNPFEAIVGELKQYAVHLCEARAHENDEEDILAGVLQPALEAAIQVKREDARCCLCDFDAVYSLLTVVVTDRHREKDEREVFKLIYHDWDEQIQKRNLSDTEYEEQCRMLERRMYALLMSVFRRDGMSSS